MSFSYEFEKYLTDKENIKTTILKYGIAICPILDNKECEEMINNKETGAALLRIIEVIGPEKIEDIDDDTVYFIINTLNQLNADLIRNKLLLKVLPLKV